MNMKYQQIGFFKIEDFENLSDAMLCCLSYNRQVHLQFRFVEKSY